jgi:hypothetical protein
MASRYYGLRTLNHAIRVTAPVRRIHSNGTAASPSALLDSSSRYAVYIPRMVTDLRAECKRRGLTSSGKKSDVVNPVDKFTVYADASQPHVVSATIG